MCAIRNRGLKGGLLYHPGEGDRGPSLLLGVLVLSGRQTSGSWELAGPRAAGEEASVSRTPTTPTIVGIWKEHEITHTKV